MTSSLANEIPWKVGKQLPASLSQEVRTGLILNHCKWDPQVGDVSTLASFPIFLKSETWNHLKKKAQALAEELLAAEREISIRPDLITRLGMPRQISKLLAKKAPPMAAGTPRVMRFDFHYSTDGWRISEVNNDVPGGFTESSTFAEMVQTYFPGSELCGNPVRAWIQSISSQFPDGKILLFAAPGYMEDQQIVSYLAKTLRTEGLSAQLATPKQLKWSIHRRLTLNNCNRAFDCVVRFFQAEWLPRLGAGWENFFLSDFPIVNPGVAIIGESKRFPLVWNDLESPTQNWRELLPDTHDPKEIAWLNDEQWILKTAYCNNGDTVILQEQLSASARRKLRYELLFSSGSWIVQKRFQPVWFDTPLGLAQLCIGVYIINGQPAGAYGRLTSKRIIDHAAIDVPILIFDSNDEA
jgi:glutathionylspermidine synthase